MAENTPNTPPNRKQPPRKYGFERIDDAQMERLRAEAAAPYRGLRKFIYVTFAGSGAIGGFVFLAQVLAGRDIETALPNLALQIGVVALMVWLFRIDRGDRK